MAKELRTNVGESHPLWQKAAAMGAQIDPTNPLYGGAGGSPATYSAMAPAAAHAKPDVDFDLEGSSSAGGASSAPAPDFDLDLEGKKGDASSLDGMGGTSSGIDFDASTAPAAASSLPPKEEKPSFDFDLSGLEFPGASKPGGGTDLELDPTRPAANTSAASAASGLDLADLSLDSPGDTGGGGAGVETKLELAKAYLEIGDKDGARDILQEVAKEGSSAQKEEAQKLIASL